MEYLTIFKIPLFFKYSLLYFYGHVAINKNIKLFRNENAKQNIDSSKSQKSYVIDNIGFLHDQYMTNT